MHTLSVVDGGDDLGRFGAEHHVDQDRVRVFDPDFYVDLLAATGAKAIRN